ncbi:c-type cytochrome [Pontibacter vulgaris]|uniref:c-type cytochrome n=1 Tax=Pontibacter vulgaris TaxID=2905679 RepID=UPI001FA74A20|nr:c-type cytochrome [Pontibacter vulgaris]
MKPNQEQDFGDILVKITRIVSLSILAIILLLGVIILIVVNPAAFKPSPEIAETASKVAPASAPAKVAKATKTPANDMWRPADLDALPNGSEKEQLAYGRELIAHTAKYLGPKGSVLQISNGMNCQNCHLDAGTKPFGNNYSLVASTYPKFRARSGTKEDIYKRVNDCIERSLNGKPLTKDSKEMQAMMAYINWVGKDVKKGEKPKGAGLKDIELLDRAASPEKGKVLYVQKCQVCHGKEGEGMKPDGSAEYQFPPLWGKNSYNDGAGLYRISNFAKYAKANMPLGVTYESPQLSDEEAWDVAAFVNSMPRPKKDLSKDWPDISGKPFDHPFGPYADKFDEKQHKYGPFKQIIAAKEKTKS